MYFDDLFQLKEYAGDYRKRIANYWYPYAFSKTFGAVYMGTGKWETLYYQAKDKWIKCLKDEMDKSFNDAVFGDTKD